ncbi:ATP-dependent helicase [Ruminococcaceae bacterium TF06-43]|jgi:DNA helicase-2/ATP-dependent DNA helicase PcrA|nr:ATP-dependent helicase [Ruminococcaceae bacterium TF06-43]
MSESKSLTPAQEAAIAEINSNLQIIACAGSGKTEVIARRIANILESKENILPESIVAFTFTEKAAENMKVRIAKALGKHQTEITEKMYIGTIHGFCYALLKNFAEDFRDFRILDTVKSHHFITRYYKDCGMSDLGLELHPRNVILFLQCVDKMIDAFDESELWAENQKAAFEKYRKCLFSHRYIDFSFLIFEALQQIRSKPDVKKALSNIRYLIVDEYQDVNDLQEKVISEIANAGANICVVGDDDQTIYQFRGSNAENMISFSKRYPHVKQVRLETNFRCSHRIVDIADTVISHNENRLDKKMQAGKRSEKSCTEAIRYNSQSEEFAGIAHKIRELHHSGIPYGEISILVRKGKIIAPITTALDSFEIPYETDSAEKFFSGSYFSRFATTLQLLVDIDKSKLHDCWHDIVESTLLTKGFKYLRSCARNGRMTLREILEGFCEQITFIDDSIEDCEERKENLAGITKILDDYDEIYGDWQLSARITGVLRFLAYQAEEEYKYHSFTLKDFSNDMVQIMTVHKAKGLEFHTVFLPELMMREFPASNVGGKKYWHVLGGIFEENKSKYQGDLEDERKLFYVAVTRARQNLFMTYELSEQPISCFVTEAAASQVLKINRADLTYTQTNDSDITQNDYMDENPISSSGEQRKAEQKARQQYWNTVRYAKRQLYNYYGTACHYFPGAHGDLERLRTLSPDEILRLAATNGLI